MRRLITDIDHNTREFLGADKPKRERGPNKAKIRREIREMIGRKDFEGAKPSHLVALYEYCHEMVYGEAPLEIDSPTTWKMATYAAGRLVKKHFEGDAVSAVEFVRWTWVREKQRLSWRAKRGITSTRLGWRLQFRDDMVTDYRIASRGEP